MRNIFLYLIALPADTNEKYANAWRQNVCFSIRIWFDFTACPQVSSVLWHCRHHLGTTATGWLYRATANGGGFDPALLVAASCNRLCDYRIVLGRRTPLLQRRRATIPGSLLVLSYASATVQHLHRPCRILPPVRLGTGTNRYWGVNSVATGHSCSCSIVKSCALCVVSSIYHETD